MAVAAGRRFKQEVNDSPTGTATWKNTCSCLGRAGSCDKSSITAVARPSTLDPPSSGISVLELNNECGLCTATRILADCHKQEGIAQSLPCEPLKEMLPPGPLHPHQTLSLPYNGPAGAWPILAVNFECATE